MEEQNKQVLGVEPVQLKEKSVEKPRKKRTQEEKVGRQKWHEVLTKQSFEKILFKLEKVEESQRVILNGLKGAGYFRFTVPLLQRDACCDQVDIEILELVREAGLTGVFPKDVAKELQAYKLKYYDVSRRIVRMNKRLKLEIGELLFEKRGHKWALTRFAAEVYGDTDLGAAGGAAALGYSSDSVSDSQEKENSAWR